MDKVYKHEEVEKKWYDFWEKSSFFTPKIDKKKKPFTIILPLPNANDPIHMGHGLFTVEDIMVRYHRMLGEPTLWLPGADHAGIETQFVFEKKLVKEGKSRFDFSRENLYKMIADYVEENKNTNRDQLKQMGFSLDWTRYHYSLEPGMVEKAIQTFKKLYEADYISRGERIVNFCTHCGTAFSDLEVVYEEKQDSLYYLDYGLIQIATTRPETIFADVAVAVNPKDKRYQKLIGKKADIPLIKVKIPIIADEKIDPDFGTGALKVTPAHDATDFEIGQKNNLETISIINRQGRLTEGPRVPKELFGLNIKQAREKSIDLLKETKKLTKTEPLTHSVGTCYRCSTTIEPMVIPQWYIKTKELAKPAIEAVKKGKTKIIPGKRFEKLYLDWMENIKDWNISRQIVWGPRIPIWYKVTGHEQRIWAVFVDKKGKLRQGSIDQHKRLENISLDEIKQGLQQIIVPIYTGKNQPEIHVGATPPPEGDWIQETDTFDTWFLSSQWPVNTLKSKPGDFEYFYPTSVLDTLWDILFFWVGRMMMMGIYLTGEVPFKVVHIHSRVVDKEGKKMSKSRGNVLNPIDMVEKYGADALRMALILGVAPAGDIAISEEKIRGMRNFTNKIWNSGRFVTSPFNKLPKVKSKIHPDDKWITEELKKTTKEVTSQIEKYRFGQASELLYDFFWHTFCDKYIEMAKKRRSEAQPTLEKVFSTSLFLLHPFMPFITEELWHRLGNKTSIMIQDWPV